MGYDRDGIYSGTEKVLIRPTIAPDKKGDQFNIILIFLHKLMLRVLIRSTSMRCF